MEGASLPGADGSSSYVQGGAEHPSSSTAMFADSDACGRTSGECKSISKPPRILEGNSRACEKCACNAAGLKECKCTYPAPSHWLCAPPGFLGSRSERSSSESSTCAAEQFSSPPASPDSACLFVLFSDSAAGEECPTAEGAPDGPGEPQDGASSSAHSTSFSCLPSQKGAPLSRRRLSNGSSSRGFLDAFYSRQREQQINELKGRYEAQQSLATWRRAAPNTTGSRNNNSSSSSSSSSSVLSRFLRSSSLTKQQLRMPLAHTASTVGRMPEAEQQLQLEFQETQLQQQERDLQQQQSLLHQLQVRAGERPRGALVAARSQMLQREQQQDAQARRCCVPSGFGNATVLGLSQHQILTDQLRAPLGGKKRRMRSLPARLMVWDAATLAAATTSAAAAPVASEGRDSSSKNNDWRAQGPVARELDGVAAEAAAKAAAQSAAAAAAATRFRESVELFQSLRRTASDAQLFTRGRGPCWAGQRLLTRAGVEELLDNALEVGTVTVVAAPPHEAAGVARSVESLVAALQVRVAQGQQRVKFHFLMQQVTKNSLLIRSPTADTVLRRNVIAGPGTGNAAAAPSSMFPAAAQN